MMGRDEDRPFWAFSLEKAVYELGYGLNNRSSWVMIPIQGVQRLLSAQGENEKKGEDGDHERSWNDWTGAL